MANNLNLVMYRLIAINVIKLPIVIIYFAAQVLPKSFITNEAGFFTP